MFTRLLTLPLLLALAAAACGSSPEDIEGAAQVAVDGVHPGCADLIDAGVLLAGLEGDDVSPENLSAMREALSRARGSFDDAPGSARRYLELLEGALSATSRAVAERGQANNEQIALLLGVEFVAMSEELDQTGRESVGYFETACDAVFTADGGLTSPGNGAIDLTGSAVEPDPVPIDGISESGDEMNSTTTTVAPPAAFLDVDETSSGASGTYLLLELEVGEIWRTNVEPSEALVEGTDAVGTEDEFVLVGLRVTSVASSASMQVSSFGWVDSTGVRTAAVSMLDATGHEMFPSVSQSESVNGYLVFPGSVGDVEGAVLEVLGSGAEPENIPLSAGAEASPYPVSLEAGKAGSGLYESSATVCIYPLETEVRSAVVSLDGVDRGNVLRAPTGKRFLTIDLAVDVLSVSGASCDWATTMYFNQWAVRLELDNGDVIAPYYFDGRGEVGATSTAIITFQFPADTETFEFVDGTGAVLASWSDLDLPDA